MDVSKFDWVTLSRAAELLHQEALNARRLRELSPSGSATRSVWTEAAEAFLSLSALFEEASERKRRDA